MFDISPIQIIIVLAIALLIFGPKRLPGMGRDLGRGIRDFKAGKWATELLGEDLQGRFAEVKQMQADRCPKELGKLVKAQEIQFHHEVTNQLLWSMF